MNDRPVPWPRTFRIGGIDQECRWFVPSSGWYIHLSYAMKAAYFLHAQRPKDAYVIDGESGEIIDKDHPYMGDGRYTNFPG